MQVTVSENASFKVKLHAASLAGGLIFKEIYYSGSETLEGKAYFSDQFVEIYNNSDEVLYLDGIAISCIAPEASGKNPSKWVDVAGNLLPRLAVSGYACYFPGSGKDYPIQPRTSIVIAQDAIDHQSDPLGNPNSPVNLGPGKANWELYVGHINQGKDADVADVPNLEVLYATQTTRHDALYSVFGPAMILFRLPQGVDPKEFAKDSKNIATEPGDTKGKTKYLMIPKEYVIDAVEGIRPEEEKRNKRLHIELDAGYVFCEKAYNSKSIRRKVKQIVDGKVIYQDSNNSSKDFLGDQTPAPGVHPL